ncbi:hypothetical protein [Mucilaginibacter lappiensis]|uniref:Uncharacterized protein n=1 Tax=Mucilaginibacter lappiensis TaxID=354630 RepID=A0A1N7ETT3_9SPHI|nr:hypothetical protein [Mucilaginibacter lappiensis]MBB6111986.1 hypothetical protein [Mucilaginibacter lappiensis]MBB6126495.1 hypothetical protein [Mucilaginibacter lappiensis]SIR91476.1 hypothetical protein SAMN05421821_11591 [Mucilaginibacter lappiensis]
MKKTHFLIAFALLIAVTLASCSKDKNDANNGNNNNNPGNDSVTFVINGGTFKNKVITFHADSKQAQNGAFVGNSGYLKINLTDTPPGGTSVNTTLDIALPHAATGKTNVSDPITNNILGGIDKKAYFLLQLQENGDNRILDWDHKTPTQTPGTITVTKFESVNGVVEGDFQGTVVDNYVNYVITKGHFVATRKS